MALRRMLHRDVIQSDAFMDLPFSAQMLYVQIVMAADDDGFFNGARRTVRLIGATAKDLEQLVEHRFLLQYGDVVVVKHWRMANSLQNDRLKPLSYPEIAEKLYIKPNRAYTEDPDPENENLLMLRANMLRSRNPFGIPIEEKGTEEKIKEDKVAVAEAAGIQMENETLRQMDGALGKGVLLLTQEQTEDLLSRMGLDCFEYYTDKLSSFILNNDAKVKNHYQTLLRWWQEDSQT